MSRSIANVVIQTDNWEALIDKTNQLLTAFSTEIVTANATLANTTGNMQVIGSIGANTIAVTNSLTGGNVSSPATLLVGSNVTINGVTNTAGNVNIVGVLTSTGNVALYSNSTVLSLTITNNGTATVGTINVGTFNVTGVVNAESNVAVGGDLAVTGTSEFVANVTLDDHLSVTNVASFQSNIIVAGGANLASLSVVGNTSLSGGTVVVLTGASSNTTIGGALLTVTANVSITGIANTLALNANTLAVANTTTLSGPTTIASTANIQGLLTANTANIVGNVVLGAAGKTVVVAGVVNSAIIPASNSLALGNSTSTWNVGYINTVTTQQITSNGPLLFQNDYVIDVAANTNVGVGANIVVYRFAKATYSSGEILVQVKANNNIQTSKIIVATDGGSNASLTTYGTITVGPLAVANQLSPLGTFSANVNVANVEIVFNQSLSNSSVKVVANLLVA